MSDSETPGPVHPTHGGKSLQSLERPRYKSWRKKYRKMRHKFDGTLEENKKMFKEEQKLEGIAKRLREELDGLLELCLDLNQSPSLPPTLRFSLSYPSQPASSKFIPADISPETANQQFLQYQDAVKKAQLPNIDLAVARAQMEERLAAQETEPLSLLEGSVSHPVLTASDPRPEGEEEDGLGPAYLTTENETEHLARMDAKLERELGPLYIGPPSSLQQKKLLAGNSNEQGPLMDEKHWAELTPRELERQVELLNPMSQHNWLRVHKVNSTTIGEKDDDAESLASHSHEASSASKAPRKRGGKDKNLAKQVGDRAVERAREGGGGAESPNASEEEVPASGGGGRKRKDPDATYRLKGAKSLGPKGAASSKRKRSGGEEVVAAGKKRRVEGEDVGEDGEGAVGV